MKINKFVEDLKAKSAAELNEELVAAKKELFNLRFQNATNQLENTSRIKEVRKNIARIQTVITDVFFFTIANPMTVDTQRSANHSSRTISRVFSSFSKQAYVIVLLSYLFAQASSLVLSWGLKYIVDESVSIMISAIVVLSVIGLTLLSIIVKVKGTDEGTESFDRLYSNKIFKSLLGKPASYFSAMSRGLSWRDSIYV